MICVARIHNECTQNDGSRKHLRAERLRELAVVQRRRVRIAFDTRVVYDLVQVICRDTRFDVRRHEVKDLTSKLTVG